MDSAFEAGHMSLFSSSPRTEACGREEKNHMLISDSRTIGVGSEEPEKKMSSKLGWGDSVGKALGSVENAAMFSPSKKSCGPDLMREKKLSWII